MLIEERDTFDRNLSEWLKSHTDRVVVIKGREVFGFFDNEEDALGAAAIKYGAGPYLVRRIVAAQSEVSVPALVLGLLGGYPTFAPSGD